MSSLSEMNTNAAGGFPGALLEEELTSLHAQLTALGDAAPCRGVTAHVAPRARDCIAHLQSLVTSAFLNTCSAIKRAQVLIVVWCSSGTSLLCLLLIS
jgi:hypothetical protein